MESRKSVSEVSRIPDVKERWIEEKTFHRRKLNIEKQTEAKEERTIG